MSDLPKIPAEAKEIIKHNVADPNTDTTHDDFRQDLEIKVTRVNIEAHTKK